MRNKLISSLAGAAFILAASGLAFAADMAVKAPPPAPVPIPVFTWTGCYIGATLGYGSVHGESTLNVGDALFPVGFSRSATFNGGLFGVEAGANYQFNWVVVGIERDWQGSTISGTSVSHSPMHPAVFTDAHRDLDSISTVTGRLGIAWDRWLLYG
jgi:outer membrane immunogenic protein